MLTVSGNIGSPGMPDTDKESADSGGVLQATVAAVMLILAGLSMLILDNSLDVVAPAQASAVQQR